MKDSDGKLAIDDNHQQERSRQVLGRLQMRPCKMLDLHQKNVEGLCPGEGATA